MKYEPYPRMLYKQDDNGHPEHVFDGVKCAVLTVANAEEENTAKSGGWSASPVEAAAAKRSAIAKKAAKTRKEKKHGETHHAPAQGAPGKQVRGS